MDAQELLKSERHPGSTAGLINGYINESDPSLRSHILGELRKFDYTFIVQTCLASPLLTNRTRDSLDLLAALGSNQFLLSIDKILGPLPDPWKAYAYTAYGIRKDAFFENFTRSNDPQTFLPFMEYLGAMDCHRSFEKTLTGFLKDTRFPERLSLLAPIVRSGGLPLSLAEREKWFAQTGDDAIRFHLGLSLLQESNATPVVFFYSNLGRFDSGGLSQLRGLLMNVSWTGQNMSPILSAFSNVSKKVATPAIQKKNEYPAFLQTMARLGERYAADAKDGTAQAYFQNWLKKRTFEEGMSFGGGLVWEGGIPFDSTPPQIIPESSKVENGFLEIRMRGPSDNMSGLTHLAVWSEKPLIMLRYAIAHRTRSLLVHHVRTAPSLSEAYAGSIHGETGYSATERSVSHPPDPYIQVGVSNILFRLPLSISDTQYNFAFSDEAGNYREKKIAQVGAQITWSEVSLTNEDARRREVLGYFPLLLPPGAKNPGDEIKIELPGIH